MSSELISDRPYRPADEATNLSLQWNSDAIVEQLSRLGLEYIALVPGSSYRGVHDSLVNYKENTNPQMLVCLHEEHTVAIAHGYAKVTDKPMAVAVHANVGLMHATMAVYNAFTDRVPVVMIGATGPLDAAQRRPWIDWVHTAGDQAALIRPFIKFDDQPHSVPAAMASLVRATALAAQKPRAPVYVCLDVSLQEQKLAEPESVRFPPTERYLTMSTPGAAAEDVELVNALLAQSRKPLFMFGRVNRTQQGWDERVQLAERYEVRVLTDLKQAAAFPTQHLLHASAPAVFNTPRTCEMIREADVIVSFEWVDLAGTLQAAYPGGEEPAAKIVHISLDTALHNGWSKDHFGHPPVDHSIAADADKFVSSLIKATPSYYIAREWTDSPSVPVAPTSTSDAIYMTDLSQALYSTVSPDDMCIIRVPLGWKGGELRATHPLSYLGQDGGGGLASGPGQAVGSALALKDSNLLPVAILGDGDFLMGGSALWTAARYRLPLLVIIANNASFFNDEVHQERVARARSRPVENKWIGIRIDDPMPDLSQNAASLGATVVSGQVQRRGELGETLRRAVEEVKCKRTVVVVDVEVRPDGYSAALEKAK
jgi:thiamine pyrophosphate-dependent acetolactate synthase large subunit-like protein